MYYPYFITYIGVGFIIALLVFFWALKTGQFSDQTRARFLPLEEKPETNDGNESTTNRLEFYALGALVLSGLAASAVVLVLALI